MPAAGRKSETRLSGLIAQPNGSTLAGQITFGDRVESVETRASAGDNFILPGFIDLQINGSHGVDVMTASPEGIIKIARLMTAEGTTAFLPTAVTSPLEQIEAVDRAIHTAAGSQAESEAGAEGAEILGMHLEGPFISSARLGAHLPLNLAPLGSAFERVLQLRRLRLITLAPELSGAGEAIRRLGANGVAVSIGHSDATLEQAQDAIAAGAKMFTHLFNAMRPLNHRDPGLIGAALKPSSAFAAVIPDGLHVHREILRLIWRARGAHGMVLTPDRVALCGLKPEESATVAGAQARISGGVARLENGALAGSIVTMLEGVRLMVEKIGVSVGEAALMAASNPAKVLGLSDRGTLTKGARADITVLDRHLSVKAVFVGGHELS